MPRRVWGNTLKQVTKDSEERKRRAVIDFVRFMPLNILKTGTTDSAKDWFAVGDYKRLPNEVGGRETTLPENVAKETKSLLKAYNSNSSHSFEDIVDYHVRFERIHPFQDGNGRVGRLIMLKECLAHNVVPFVITENMKSFYYRGLSKWDKENGYLLDTCLAAQDRFKATLDYFRIAYITR